MSKLLTLNFTILLYLVLFSSCATVSSRVEPPLQVVSRVDINKYLGRWYEIDRSLGGNETTVGGGLLVGRR